MPAARCKRSTLAPQCDRIVCTCSAHSESAAAPLTHATVPIHPGPLMHSRRHSARVRVSRAVSDSDCEECDDVHRGPVHNAARPRAAGRHRALAQSLKPFPLPRQSVAVSVLRALHPPLSSAPQAAHSRAVDRIVLFSARLTLHARGFTEHGLK